MNKKIHKDEGPEGMEGYRALCGELSVVAFLRDEDPDGEPLIFPESVRIPLLPEKISVSPLTPMIKPSWNWEDTSDRAFAVFDPAPTPSEKKHLEKALEEITGVVITNPVLELAMKIHNKDTSVPSITVDHADMQSLSVQLLLLNKRNQYLKVGFMPHAPDPSDEDNNLYPGLCIQKQTLPKSCMDALHMMGTQFAEDLWGRTLVTRWRDKAEEQLLIRFSHFQKLKMQNTASELDITVSEFIRNACEHYLDYLEKEPLSVFEKLEKRIMPSRPASSKTGSLEDILAHSIYNDMKR